MPKQRRTPRIVDGVKFSHSGERDFGKKQAPYFLEVRESSVAGNGVFVYSGKISRGDIILSYTGPLLTHAEWGAEWEERFGDLQAEHVGRLDYFATNGGYVINGSESFTSFVNHSCTPNLEVVCMSENVLFKALREIFPDEELYIDYNLQGDALYPCACGAEACRGFMNNTDNIKKALRKRAKKGHK